MSKVQLAIDTMLANVVRTGNDACFTMKTSKGTYLGRMYYTRNGRVRCFYGTSSKPLNTFENWCSKNVSEIIFKKS